MNQKRLVSVREDIWLIPLVGFPGKDKFLRKTRYRIFKAQYKLRNGHPFIKKPLRISRQQEQCMKSGMGLSKHKTHVQLHVLNT